MGINIGQTQWQFCKCFPEKSLGDPTYGGYLMCKSGSIGWIVAPDSSEVSRTWFLRCDATITAQCVSGCSDWFIPTCAQLINPGCLCRQYWDSYAPTPGTWNLYWSDTEDGNYAWCIGMGPSPSTVNTGKTQGFLNRAFRCVTY